MKPQRRHIDARCAAQCARRCNSPRAVRSWILGSLHFPCRQASAELSKTHVRFVLQFVSSTCPFNVVRDLLSHPPPTRIGSTLEGRAHARHRFT